MRQAANSCSHTARAALPRLATSRAWFSTVSVTSKVFSGSKPSTFLVAAISASPSAEPCALPVFCASGAGQAMIVRIAMMDGREVSALAAVSASAMACTSTSPLLLGATRWTCQPYAS
ncbi:hypothetical protein P3T34_005549 [Kitasatospora sp. MAP12-44]|nr:hypothetical protein [Kitasatospora sp. MAP12-44]